MRLYDTHCHLAWGEDEAPAAELVARAEASGVAEMLCVAVDLRSARRCRELAGEHSAVRASVGIHPNDLPTGDEELEEALVELDALGAEKGWAAIGETGMDFHWDTVPGAVQRRGFVHHLELAARRALPVIIHCRKAADRVLEVLRERSAPITGVMHCYSEGSEHVTAFLDLGLHVSFAGNLTYKKSEDLREAARRVPLDRLLVETDSPFLAPQAVRGRRNEPAYVRHTLEHIAAVRGMTPAELAARTRANALELFG